jgi:hypothetical protein
VLNAEGKRRRHEAADRAPRMSIVYQAVDQLKPPPNTNLAPATDTTFPASCVDYDQIRRTDQIVDVPALPHIERTFTSALRISLVVQTSSEEPPSEPAD